ncbi:hypothetical protein [Rhodovulum sulfidophilum]|uniref:hypothetical protein n=1 Tax=Rhodovulum sulfidophilum TaxID=35806 RepID=UPI000AECA914|nr:hypothetical protein [Rhodovulum sulfidophilum]
MADESASSIAERNPEAAGDGSLSTFCATCPNWIEIQFQSRIPANMPTCMAVAKLQGNDIPVDEAGLQYVVTDVDQESFETRGRLDARGFSRINLPSNLPEVQFAFGSERPDDVLGVPEGEVAGDRASREHWAVDMGRGALTGIERGINGMMRAADDFGFWVGWNPGMVKIDGKWVWMDTEERKEFFETNGRPEFLDLGVDRPNRTAGQMTEGVTQFLVGFIPAVRAVRLVGAVRVVGSTGTYMAAGAIADATVFDPHEQRLANLVQRYPKLRNPITEYLASDPGDSAAEGRLKNALEGLLFGAVLDRFVAGLRVMRSGINRMVVTLKTQYRYIFDTESLDTVIFVLLKAARTVEPQITPMLQSLAKRFNGHMVGLDFRFKSEESLARKISGEAVDTGEYYSKVAEGMKDVLRYTTIFPDQAYAEGVRATRAELSKQGFSEVKFKNTWGEVGYKGINAVYRTVEGFKFELQFHTSASYKAKETGTHALYEQQRVLEPGSKAWQKLEDAQNAVFDQIPVPHEARGLE